MSLKKIINKDQFWGILKYLTELDHPQEVDSIVANLNITRTALNTYLNFLSEVGFSMDIESLDGGKKQLRPPESKPEINVKFSLLEWLEFQAHFPAIEQASDLPIHAEFQAKIAKLENTYHQYDLFEPLQTMEEIMHQQKPSIVPSEGLNQLELISYIEESILEKQSLFVSLSSQGMSYTLHPFSLIYLEGELSLIGENVADKSLINIPVSHIERISDEEIQFNSSHSRLEINDFIASIRAISENETRLVLKIHALASFENSIPRNFLGNPAMITNPNGDLIWGASVEPNPEIFNWLHDLGADVEILDPISFKKDYLAYCEELLKKLA